MGSWERFDENYCLKKKTFTVVFIGKVLQMLIIDMQKEYLKF